MTIHFVTWLFVQVIIIGPGHRLDGRTTSSVEPAPITPEVVMVENTDLIGRRRRLN